VFCICLLHILVVFDLGLVLVFIELIHYLLEERAHIAFFFAFQNVGFLNIDAFQESAMQCERIRTVLTLPGDSAPDLSIFGLAL
jgi:hypothetical protein